MGTNGISANPKILVINEASESVSQAVLLSALIFTKPIARLNNIAMPAVKVIVITGKKVIE